EAGAPGVTRPNLFCLCVYLVLARSRDRSISVGLGHVKFLEFDAKLGLRHRLTGTGKRLRLRGGEILELQNELLFSINVAGWENAHRSIPMSVLLQDDRAPAIVP